MCDQGEGANAAIRLNSSLRYKEKPAYWQEMGLVTGQTYMWGFDLRPLKSK